MSLQIVQFTAEHGDASAVENAIKKLFDASADAAPDDDAARARGVRRSRAIGNNEEERRS